MDLGPLRGLATELAFDAHGVPATVTRPFPDVTPIVTRGIWMTPGLSRPFTEAFPRDFALQRREPERVMALQRSAVPTVPKGTRIDASEQLRRKSDSSAMFQIQDQQTASLRHAASARVLVCRSEVRQ